MPNEVHLPATGDVDYQYVLVKTNFKEDMWVSAVELRPGNRQVVHHMRAYVLPPGSHYVDGAVPGVPFIMKDLAARAVVTGRFCRDTFARGGSSPSGISWPERADVRFLQPLFIPKRFDIAFEIHYHHQRQTCYR